MHLTDFFLLLTILFAVGISMHLYKKYTGKEMKFTQSSLYQTLGVLLAIFLMWKWSVIQMNGEVHEFSEEVAKIIVNVVQRVAKLLGLR